MQTETVIAPLSPAEPKGWIGERTDPETGLTYLHARYYDASLGRFLSPDWWNPSDPAVGTDRYGYSMGDPINKSDPNGHQAQVLPVLAACLADPPCSVALAAGVAATAKVVAEHAAPPAPCAFIYCATVDPLAIGNVLMSENEDGKKVEPTDKGDGNTSKEGVVKPPKKRTPSTRRSLTPATRRPNLERSMAGDLAPTKRERPERT